MTRIALLVALAGCGFRITPGSNTGDGGPSDGDMQVDGADADATTPTDAPVDGPLQPTCLLAWLNQTITFQSAAQLASLSSTSYDRDPFVSVDELTIWFSNGGATSQGGGDVFKATRATRAQPFGAPARDPDFSTSGGAESKMSMTQDRLFAVVASSQSGGAGGSDIWETSRPTSNAAWGPISRSHTSGLATAGSELDPFVNSDGLRLYYSPTSPSPQRIMVAKRASLSEVFASPTEVGGVNSGSGEWDPTLIANDRVIIFASDRTSSNGSGNLWYATRATGDAAFGTPLEVPGVNTDFDEGDAHVSADGCHIYFSRDVGGGVDWELFSAAATP